MSQKLTPKECGKITAIISSVEMIVISSNNHDSSIEAIEMLDKAKEIIKENTMTFEEFEQHSTPHPIRRHQ